MWHDGEFDMDELEARLYSQVYHSNEEELPMSKPDIIQESLSAKTSKRYFDGGGIHQPPYGSENMHRLYHRNRTYFTPGENIDSHRPTSYYSNSTNFYEPIGLFTYPAVNNIVVLPQPPAQIFTQHRSAEQRMTRSKRHTIKRREKRQRAKEKWKAKMTKKAFKEHTLSAKKITLEHQKETSNTSGMAKDEIIYLSESDSSDCEIAEMEVPSIVVSSDDEMDDKELHHGDVIVEIKNETVTKVDAIVEQIQSKQMEPLKVTSNTDKREINVELKDVPFQASDDDDVVLVEPSQTEILTICDESQSATDLNSSFTSNPAENNPPVPVNNATLNKVLDTPESTNDFLDNSFTSSQTNVDAGNTASVQKVGVNDFESDSNYSASDFDVSSRSAIFTEQEFDVPSKGSFAELNLDSFTTYIASKASTSIPSILTPPNRSASGICKNNKSKDTSIINTSDSSSESDYEDKAALIQSRSKTKKRSSGASSSESDDCIVNNDRRNVPKKSPLPNLSPITSDEEAVQPGNGKANKTLAAKLQKKQKKVAANEHVSGEKRKSIQMIETEIKRLKQNKASAHSNKLKSKGQEEKDNFFSSSDSEVEVVGIDDESPPGSIKNLDIELLNIGSTSTPKKQLWDTPASKLKRFCDFWTEDMKKFYYDSWGHENFSVEEEQKAMSDDPTMWKIIRKDELNFKMSPKGPRCYRCKEFGHRAHNCNKKIGPPKCILCGGSGHLDARCPNKMCTSCGRRSQYFTTYCSRCKNLRNVVCKICLMRGHTSFYCADLWRRYHLTTTEGPPQQPSDSNLKASKDRWCSGCASRGHFEFNCNYYNRTHPPADPFVHSYEDIYEEREQPNDFPAQLQNENDYYARANQVNPWMLGCQPNVYASNFIQNHGPNPNFYQQFPVFQSMPTNVFGVQQNLSNMFYPNSSLVPVNRNIQDVHVPNTSQSSSRACVDRNLLAEIGPKPDNESGSRTWLTHGQKRDFIKLTDSSMRQLVSREGLDFLRKLSADVNVTFKIIKRKKRKKYIYWCMLEGAHEVLPNVRVTVMEYCGETDPTPTKIMETFNGKEFSLEVLQECIFELGNPNVEWVKVAKKLFYHIREAEKKLTASKNDDAHPDRIEEFENSLKSHCIALNAILLGKVDFADGRRNTKILTEAAASGTLYKISQEKLRRSYNYVFKNNKRYNDESYRSVIFKLPCPVTRKADIEKLFQSGSSICKDNNMTRELRRLTFLYKKAVCFMAPRPVDDFKKFYDRIKNKQ